MKTWTVDYPGVHCDWCAEPMQEGSQRIPRRGRAYHPQCWDAKEQARIARKAKAQLEAFEAPPF